MEKLKKIVSSGHQKNPDNVNRPTTAGGTPIPGVHKNGEHPIYDEMTSPVAKSFADSTSTMDHSSAQPIASSPPHTGASFLRPDSHQRPPSSHSELSSASIKSGIIGLPQSSNKSPARPGHNQPANPSASINHEQTDSSHAGGMAANTEQHPFEESLGQSIPSSGTERSFPLAGGVKGSKQTKQTSTNAHDDTHGRENLAGTAAAAVASSAVPGHRHESANTAHASGVASGQSGQDYHPEAVAAVKAAALKTQSVPSVGQTNTGATPLSSSNTATSNQSQGSVKGLLYTQGPHPTDIANKADPELHIPGAFPSPTPINELSELSYMSSKPIDEDLEGKHELRHTGTLEDPLTKSAEPSSKDHRYGRDAAIAGGLGVAGAGAYAAGNHQESGGSDVFPEVKNPYSSTKLDPRVDISPKPSQQRRDPSSNKPHAYDPLLTNTASSQPESDRSQHGRDATLAGAGVGAVTTGALYASQRAHEPQSTGPASSTIGPHESNVANILDPRVQPDSNLQKHHQAASTVDDPASFTVGPHKSNIANVMDPRVLPDPQKQKAAPKTEKDHNHDREAAVVGRTGAGGYGAYEAAKAYVDHRSTGPEASMENQRYDSTLSPGTRAPLPNSAQRGNQSDQHDSGRDSALLGGVGAAGAVAGAYAATRGNEHTFQQAQSPIQQQQHSPVQSAPAATSTGATHQRYDSVQHGPHSPKSPQHQKHDAAIVGATGAGGAYAYSQNEDEGAQKALKQNLKDEDKLSQARQQERDKALHELEKQNPLDKQQEKEPDILDKKHQRQPSKDYEKDEKEKHKHHALFGFLHRDKDKKKTGSVESTPRASADNNRHSKEHTPATGNESSTSSLEKDARNKLHKDPPKGHPAHEQPRTPTKSSSQDTSPTVTEPHTTLPTNTQKYTNPYDGPNPNNTFADSHSLNTPDQQHAHNSTAME